MVEVQFDLVGGRTDRFITSELKLLNEIFVGVLGHTSALIGIKEDVVYIQRSGNQRLVVGGRDFLVSSRATEIANSPQALINRTDVQVDADLVILKSNQGQRKSGVAAVPELKGNIQSSLGQGIARSAYLAGGIRVTGTIDVSERRVSNVGQLGGVTDHAVVTTLLVLGESELIPDVHPVTILAIDTLSTNLNLNLRNHLLTGEIQPAGEYTKWGDTLRSVTRVSHRLVNLGQSYLQVGAVGKITITADRASDTATEIGLAIESLFNRLHGEVCVATVSYLPEGNLGVARKIYVLGTISDKLH